MADHSLLLTTGATLVLHSVLMLAAALIADRLLGARHPRLVEASWRLALFVPLLTTVLAVGAASWSRAPSQEISPQEVAPTGSAYLTEASESAMRPVAPPGLEKAPVVAPSVPAGSSPLVVTRQVERLGLVIWGVGAGVMSILLLVGIGGVVRLRLGRDRRPLPRQLEREAGELASAMRLRDVPVLALCERVRGPVALPGYAVLLPAWAVEVAPMQRHALLAHEFSHLQRGDPWLRILQRAALVPLWWQPLAWWAQRRLDAMAELDCDAQAARILGSGRPLAEILSVCLERSEHSTRFSQLAVAMAAREGEVVHRVRRLLKGNPTQPTRWSASQRCTFAVTITLICGALILSGAIGISTQAISAGEREIVSIIPEARPHSTSWVQVRGERTLKTKLDGRIEFSEDERSVANMEQGASFFASEISHGRTRELHLVGSAGGIKRSWRVDGQRQPWGSEAQTWLATLIPSIYRATGLDAEGRVQRILERGGVPTFFREYQALASDQVRGRYMKLLFHHAPLDAAETAQAFAQIAKLSSNFERADTLISAQRILHDDAIVLAGWRKAVSGLESNLERRRVLEALLRSEQPPAITVAALELAAPITSDSEKCLVLEAGALHARRTPAALQAWLRTAEGIKTDFERRGALISLVGSGPLTVLTAHGVLTSAAAIDSEVELREVLVALAAAMPADPALIERYRYLSRRMESYERGEAERALDRALRAEMRSAPVQSRPMPNA